MNTADTALQQPRRPLLTSNLWPPLLVVLLASVAIAFYGHLLTKTLTNSVASGARSQAAATAHEITGFIAREHERLDAYVAEREQQIRSIVKYPDDWAAISALQDSLQRMFRGALAFTVTDEHGAPVFADFEGLVGPVCESAMGSFANAMRRGEDASIPPIHPVPGAYHFDLITSWRHDDGVSGLFFVSMSPSRIAEIVGASQQASGMRTLLVNREDPSLIEVTSEGARDVLHEAMRLADDALSDVHAGLDIEGTHWRLLVLPDTAALATDVREIYTNVAALIAALVLISASLLFAIRRYEQRNSTLFTRSLQSSVSRQRAILQSMVDAMVTIDEQGTILHANNAVRDLFGYQPDEIIGANVKALMPEPDRSAHDGYLRHYLETGESRILGKGRELMGRRKDGSLVPVLLTLGESVEQGQRIFVGILHDMTAHRDAQRQILDQAMTIKRSHRELAEINQFASHDLQMPLQRIATLGETIRSTHDTDLSGDEKAKLELLSNEAKEVSELVRGLADYTRAGPESETRAVDLDEVVAEVVGSLETRIAQADANVLVDELGRVLGHRQQLQQVFWNLLDNALKFRDPQRHLVVKISKRATPDDVAMLTVCVSDNGIGIPREKREQIFEAFHRLHPRDAFPGNGLGLSICRKIVQAHGGHIEADGEPGGGAIFIVTLPQAS